MTLQARSGGAPGGGAAGGGGSGLCCSECISLQWGVLFSPAHSLCYILKGKGIRLVYVLSRLLSQWQSVAISHFYGPPLSGSLSQRALDLKTRN